MGSSEIEDPEESRSILHWKLSSELFRKSVDWGKKKKKGSFLDYWFDRKAMESRMDQYEIMEQIGRGAFGAAILVNHKLEKQKYALVSLSL